MRFLSLFLLLAPATAFADDAGKLQAALRNPDDSALIDLLADHVKVQLGLDTPTCAKLAGSVTREDLAPCLRTLGGKYPIVFTPGPLAQSPVLLGVGDLVYALTVKGGKMVAVAPVLTNAADAKVPTTMAGDIRFDFAPSPKLAAAIASAGGDVKSIHKICYDVHGTITSRRLVATSKLAAFDKEATALVATRKSVRPATPFGTPIAACAVVTILVPLADPNGVEGGEEGGVEGGVVGGEVGGVAGGPPPPPPPPPPAPPQNIPPTMLESSRIAGDKRIEPDDKTKVEIARSGLTKVIGSFKLCVHVDGAIAAVTLLKSTRFGLYDAKIMKTIRETWRYKPYQVNGRPVPVCTAVTFIYSQDLPAPSPPPPAP